MEKDSCLGIVGDLPSIKACPSLKRKLIARDVLALTCPLGNPLAKLPKLSSEHLLSLAGQKLILREEGSSTRSQSEEIFKALECEFFNSLVLSGNDAVKEAVIAGLGIAVLSSWTIAREKRSQELTQFKDERFRRSRKFYLIRRRDHPLIGGAKVLWNFLSEEPRK